LITVLMQIEEHNFGW